jgi:hypothetical protein
MLQFILLSPFCGTISGLMHCILSYKLKGKTLSMQFGGLSTQQVGSLTLIKAKKKTEKNTEYNNSKMQREKGCTGLLECYTFLEMIIFVKRDGGKHPSWHGLCMSSAN